MADLIGTEEVVLHVGDHSVTGWDEVVISRALDQAAAEFQIVLPASRLPAPRGAPVELFIGQDPVLRGFIGVRRVEDDGRGTRLVIAGRSRTGDLVDCSPKVSPAEWRNVSLEELLTRLAEPFGVAVHLAPFTTTGARFDKFAVQPGERVWGAIERACRLRGLLCYDTVEGDLLLSSPVSGRAVADIVQGHNVLKIVGEEADDDRFSVVYVRGQTSDSDGTWGETAALIEGTAEDLGVSRYRPLTVLAEAPVTFEGARDRARWEAQVRAARADRMKVVAPGWRQYLGGPLWAVNLLVGVRYPKLAIDTERLINAVRFSRRGDGTATDLELVRPDAYAAEPVVEPRASDWDTPTDEDLDVGGDD